MLAKPKAPKSEKKKDWKSFRAEAYAEAMASLVHFSAKTVNSNTPAYGVRLGRDRRLDLPYVALSTMDSGSIPTDYRKNANNAATVLAQASAVLENRLGEYATVPTDDIAAIRTASIVLDEYYDSGSESVGMRLRQVIVQDAEGGDIALTPLSSAGFSAVLEARLAVEHESLPAGRKRARGFLGVGGSNPQNVGRYVRAMGRPLWFQAPTEHLDVRKALAIHHKGIDLGLTHAKLLDLHRWLHAMSLANSGDMPSDLASRNEEAKKLRAIVAEVLDRAADAARLLEMCRGSLPGEALLDSDLPSIQQGLIDPSLRDPEWKREFAKAMHARLIATEFAVDGEKRWLGVGQQDSIRWIGIIEECV